MTDMQHLQQTQMFQQQQQQQQQNMVGSIDCLQLNDVSILLVNKNYYNSSYLPNQTAITITTNYGITTITKFSDISRYKSNSRS